MSDLLAPYLPLSIYFSTTLVANQKYLWGIFVENLAIASPPLPMVIEVISERRTSLCSILDCDSLLNSSYFLRVMSYAITIATILFYAATPGYRQESLFYKTTFTCQPQQQELIHTRLWLLFPTNGYGIR